MTELEVIKMLAAYSKELAETDGLGEKGLVQINWAKRLIQALHKPVVMQGLLSKCPHCQGTGIDHEIPNYEAALNSSPAVASEGQEKSVSGGNLCLHQNVIFQDDKPLCVDCGNIP